MTLLQPSQNLNDILDTLDVTQKAEVLLLVRRHSDMLEKDIERLYKRIEKSNSLLYLRDQVISHVTHLNGVTAKEILGKSRKQSTGWARHQVAAILRDMGHGTLKEIADLLNMDVTGINYCLNAHEHKMLTRTVYRKDYDLLCRAVGFNQPLETVSI